MCHRVKHRSANVQSSIRATTSSRLSVLDRTNRPRSLLAGLCVEAWTRAPYPSGGDAKRPLYVLDEVVLVCRRR